MGMVEQRRSALADPAPARNLARKRIAGQPGIRHGQLAQVGDSWKSVSTESLAISRPRRRTQREQSAGGGSGTRKRPHERIRQRQKQTGIVRGLPPRAANRIQQRFGIYALRSKQQRSAVSKVSTPAGFGLYRVLAANWRWRHGSRLILYPGDSPGRKTSKFLISIRRSTNSSSLQGPVRTEVIKRRLGGFPRNSLSIFWSSGASSNGANSGSASSSLSGNPFAVRCAAMQSPTSDRCRSYPPPPKYKANTHPTDRWRANA